MENYKLVKKDYEWLERIIQNNTYIETLYDKMIELEINGQKDTEEYTKCLNDLTIATDTENKIYQEANLNFFKCISYCEYISNYRIPKNFLDNNESIMEQDYSNKVLRRILIVLFNKIFSDYEHIKNTLPNSLIKLIRKLEITNPDKLISQAVYSNLELQKAFEKDILNGFLAFLQETIDNSEYNSFKESLICSKYYTAFINKTIESDLIDNKFEIPETLYINSRFIADFTKIDLHLYKMFKDEYGLKELAYQISEVIEMNDTDYNNSKKAVTSILRQCLMRSAFLLMSDEVLIDVNFKFHEFIEDKDYLDRHPNDHISEQKIINCFKGLKRDRKKVSVLSLKI